MISMNILNELQDDELRAVIEQSQGLLKRRDEERKAKALSEARAVLAAAGLSLKDLGKSKPKGDKGPVYKGGHSYQHPVNKALVWNANGQKPNWLRELEEQGGKAVEIGTEAAEGSAVTPIKRTA